MAAISDALRTANVLLPDAVPFDCPDAAVPHEPINQYQIHAIVHLDVVGERANRAATRAHQQQLSHSLANASNSLVSLRNNISAAGRNIDAVFVATLPSRWESVLLTIGSILLILGLIFLCMGI